MSASASVEADTVVAWLEAGRTLEEIERELLDAAPLNDEQRDALWLYAWSQQSRRPAGRRFRRDVPQYPDG